MTIGSDDGSRRPFRLAFAASALAAVLVASVLLAWVVVRDEGTSPWQKPPDVEGSRLTLHYLGSECQHGSKVEVDETAARVTLTIHTWSYALSCSDVAVRYEIEVTLDEPVGERDLVDGSGS